MKAVTVALILVFSLVLFAEVTSADEISVTTLNIGAAPDAGRHPLANATPAPGTPIRIRFAAGTIAATRTGHLAPLASDLYVLAAQRGQAMEAFVDSPGALLYVWGPDGSELLPGAEQKAAWRVVLPAKGDYFVAVNSTGRATDYKLTVIIDTPNAAGATRIRFAAGGTSAAVSGRIAAGAPARYVLRALAGQTMRVTLDSPNNNVLLTVVGADGTPLKYYHDRNTTWQGVLPATQDYHLHLVAPGSDSRFTMTVMIPSAAQTSPTRIRFAAGATSATVSGSLAQGAPARYVLWAARGQRMEIRIWPTPTEYVPPRLSVTVAGPRGSAWSDLKLDDAIDPLPASGDYIIMLALQPGSPGAGYIMEVTIPAK